MQAVTAGAALMSVDNGITLGSQRPESPVSVGADVVKKRAVLDSRLCARLAYKKQKCFYKINDLCIRYTINWCFF